MNIAGNLAVGAAEIHPRPPMGVWAIHAACAGLDPDLFHPRQGESCRPAKTVCAACPVRSDCLDFALRTGQKFGVWGGRSERERRHLRAAGSAECARCGGPFWPRRANQRYCTAVCRDAGRTTWARR